MILVRKITKLFAYLQNKSYLCPQNTMIMKKVSVLFAVLLTALGFTSCTYQATYPVEYRTNSCTLDLHVNSSQWQYTNSQEGGYYYYTFSVPELTETVYNKGVVTCYREYNWGKANAYQINLPRVFPMVDSGSNEVYQQIVDFSFLVGEVEIVVTNSDMKYDFNTPPDEMHFRLNMMW